MKLCFISSSGGHWEELMCLLDIARENDSFFITEDGGQAHDSSLDHILCLPQINRYEKGFLLHFLQLCCSSLSILRKEKPDCIITTGALIAYPFCLFGKLMGKKVIYIESFARVHDRSLTGRLVYPFADLFLVQWESMLQVYPRAVYVGSIF